MLYKEELRKNPTILYSIVFLNLQVELPCVFVDTIVQMYIYYTVSY